MLHVVVVVRGGVYLTERTGGPNRELSALTSSDWHAIAALSAANASPYPAAPRYRCRSWMQLVHDYSHSAPARPLRNSASQVATTTAPLGHARCVQATSGRGEKPHPGRPLMSLVALGNPPDTNPRSAPGGTAQSMAAKIAEASACSRAKSRKWWKCSAKASSPKYSKDRWL